ncbi:MAG: hypothetical protein J6V68_03375 [Clostridia bacterium]|nr:hypothetical protein [Clostridia bacterium]
MAFRKNKKSEEFLRLENLIEKDRLGTTCDFSTLFKIDIENLFSEYCELSDKPIISLTREKDTFIISVTVKANRIKTFAVSKN